jgi:hypothetical protein
MTTTPIEGRREAALILCCAAAPWSPKFHDRIRSILDGGVDWEVVVCAASRQGVVQSVYRALIPEFESRLPPSLHGRMRREVRGNAVRNLYLASEIVRISGLLETHGVRALALKGPALAVDIYGDVTLRQFNDLDLLVHKKDLGAAVAALVADGFCTRTVSKRIHPERFSAWEITLGRERGLFEVDLHWRLSPPYFPFTPEGDELWTRAVQVELKGARVSTLGPEDLILFLCAHGAKHGWQSLSCVCDVAQAVRAHQCDWERLVARAGSLGGLRILWLGLLLAHDLLDAAIPGELIDAARAEAAVVRAALGFRRYLGGLAVSGPGLLQRWSIPLAMIPQRSARLHYALARALLPASKDLDFVTLPRPLFPLYYLIRPLRCALEHAPGLLRGAANSCAFPEKG